MMKVNEKTIAEIVKRYQAGETPTDLARKFKVAKSSVYRWINERTERDVQSVTKLSQREVHLMQEKMNAIAVAMCGGSTAGSTPAQPSTANTADELKKLKELLA